MIVEKREGQSVFDLNCGRQSEMRTHPDLEPRMYFAESQIALIYKFRAEFSVVCVGRTRTICHPNIVICLSSMLVLHFLSLEIRFVFG